MKMLAFSSKFKSALLSYARNTLQQISTWFIICKNCAQQLQQPIFFAGLGLKYVLSLFRHAFQPITYPRHNQHTSTMIHDYIHDWMIREFIHADFE